MGEWEIKSRYVWTSLRAKAFEGMRHEPHLVKEEVPKKSFIRGQWETFPEEGQLVALETSAQRAGQGAAKKDQGNSREKEKH